MAMLTTGFNDLLKLDNLMRAFVSDKFNDMVRENEYQKIVNIVSSKRKAEDTTTISDLPKFTRKAEGNNVPYVDLTQGYDKRITNYTWSQGLAITPEMLLFDQYGQIKKGAKRMSTSGALTKEYIVANMLNYATSTTDADGYSTAGGDALALLSTAHTNLDGTTYSNKLSSWTALSYTSLQDVIDLIEASVTDNSNPIGLKVKNLIVPRKLRAKSLELTQSPYRPDNAENAINVYKTAGGWMLTPCVNHFITSQTNWYVQANEHDLTLQVAKEFSLERDTDPWNRNILYIASLICGAGFNSPRGMAGSSS